jgi:uncharacterized protein YqfB (UPF0267 family)
MSESKKPSEWIAAKLPELRQQLMTTVLEVAAKVSGYQFTSEDRAEFEASDDGKKTAKEIEVAAVTGATLSYLDEDQARREKFEADVLERIGKLESDDPEETTPRCCDRCSKPLGNSCKMSLDGRQRFCAHGCGVMPGGGE